MSRYTSLRVFVFSAQVMGTHSCINMSDITTLFARAALYEGHVDRILCLSV